ncbi:acetoin dehydrogenase dihydrolipoyllysine-residue acetyltransferase subunit [Ochrobactrum sp. BTU1]|uniref:acetoin dehydrogenase dihydrolipoyllysine-residue acetyltransferase subunit n=1 Tax=Ochrobactrum sp. BTU1 TaxID=2840456 RepID=UPI001C053F42|nr:acetoin dehydrogenase dihydrolipoyllysine-residue acetyltransferase subunit [Ochrobactrum sp. BTU1]
MAKHPISIESAGGEYMETVVIVGWSVQPGETVKAGQLILTVETAKAATEIEADRDGWLAEVFFDEGQEAPLGAVLGTISDTELSLESNAPQIAAPTATPSGLPDTVSQPTPDVVDVGQRIVASPLARRVAKSVGLDLAHIKGSGPHGRIKERDVLAAINAQPDTAIEAAVTAKKMAFPETIVSSPIMRSETVVFLHGFGADRSSWRQVTALLPSEYETIALDLPAHGDELRKAPTSLDDIVFDVSDRLEAIGIERAHIVGHSLGGAVALGLTSLGRASIRSATLLAPGGLGPEININFINGLTRSTTEESLERWLNLMVGDAANLPKGFARAALRQMQTNGLQDGLRVLAQAIFPDGTQAFNKLPALQKLEIPARIIWGRADQIIPPSHVNRVPGQIATHLLDNIGHVPQLEAPALIARLISQTVRSAS